MYRISVGVRYEMEIEPRRTVSFADSVASCLF